MDKNTKMLLGVAALAVVGYAVYQNNAKASVAAAPAPTPPSPLPPAKDYTIPALGAAAARNVQTPAVAFAASNENVKQAHWGNATGTNISPTFFKVKDSSFK